MNTSKFYCSVCFFALALAPSLATAQQQPDAGQTIQELRPAPTLPTPSRSIDIQPGVSIPATPGGPTVRIEAINISGNSIFSDDDLLMLLSGAQGQSFDLAGLKALAERITAHYHAHDYPFARAFIPAQSMAGGRLDIVVVEGRYGRISVQSDDPRADTAKEFMGPVATGNVIKGKPLERATLILDDQPGYSVIPVIRPGQDLGTGDLVLGLQRDQVFGGYVRGDNHGNRYTGRARGQAGFYANSPFMLGDQVTLNAMYTEEDMWYGSAGYNFPLWYSGLRAHVGYAHTYYELGKQFSNLDAHGTAKVASAGLSYPIIRTQKANLTLSATYQHKWLSDEQDVAGTVDKKSSRSLPLTLSFDLRDGVFGGGITYGTFSWTHGKLDLDNGLAATDATTARTNGHFDKFNLDVARLQATPVQNLTFYARASGQVAFDNLDSSEDFGLGGPNGVRAFPTGEGYGDEGWLAQAELRYHMAPVTPYLFYDYGQTKTNHKSWQAGDNVRSLGGAGVGVRADYAGWNADLSAGWRTVGGDPQSDNKDTMPMVWLRVGYSF